MVTSKVVGMRAGSFSSHVTDFGVCDNCPSLPSVTELSEQIEVDSLNGFQTECL